MFPLRDDNPTTHRSLITFLIVAINAAAWVFVQKLGAEPHLSESILRFGLIPAELTGRAGPGAMGVIGKGIASAAEGIPAWLAVITSMFMHGDWMHIIGDMWFLLVFGDNVEDAMGPVRFLLFYLVCGAAAVGAQVFSDPGSGMPMVGASGAISGVMGAYLLLYPRAPVHMLVFLGVYARTVVVPAYLMLGYWIVLQVASGMISQGAGGIAFWAHVGGFGAGFVLVRLFCTRSRLAAGRARIGAARSWIARA